MYRFGLESGAHFPEEGGYQILSGLSRVHSFIHGRSDVQIGPVRGARTRQGVLCTDRSSFLYVRGITSVEAGLLSGSAFEVSSEAHRLRSVMRLGTAEPVEMRPSSGLVSRLVVFESDGEAIGEAWMMSKLAQRAPLGCSMMLSRRRSIQVKGCTFIGFGVRLEGLSPEDSMEVQRTGLGRFTSMGCGVFAPVRAGGAA